MGGCQGFISVAAGRPFTDGHNHNLAQATLSLGIKDSPKSDEAILGSEAVSRLLAQKILDHRR
jgi:hypothetical protein